MIRFYSTHSGGYSFAWHSLQTALPLLPEHAQVSRDSWDYKHLSLLPYMEQDDGERPGSTFTTSGLAQGLGDGTGNSVMGHTRSMTIGLAKLPALKYLANATTTTKTTTTAAAVASAASSRQNI